MRLAANEITVRMDDGLAVTLRPTLRAAARLEGRHGFPALFRGVQDGNLSIITDLIREGSEDQALTVDAFPRGYADLLDRVTVPLLEFIVQLTGYSDDAPAERQDGPAVPFAEHYARLYRLATGWLGWPPEQAWSATPAEISEAYLGRVEMLKAIYGGGSGQGEQPAPDAMSLDDKVSAGLRKLRPFVAKEASR